MCNTTNFYFTNKEFLNFFEEFKFIACMLVNFCQKMDISNV
jgi:hypothetical protein